MKQSDPATNIRMRPDLRFERLQYRGKSYWNVADPVSIRYFQLRDEEHFVLTSLDGATTLAEIRDRFERRFAPRRVESHQLHWLLGQLHREGLVTSDSPDQGRHLLERRTRLKWLRRLEQFGNILAIRFPGVHPGPLLDTVYPAIRWLFSPLVFLFSILAIAFSAAWGIIHIEVIAGELPAVSALLSIPTLLLIAVVLGTSKIAHEMAHALTCKHFGGECREIGAMLLVFTPCLYCNVSDAWMIPSKWRRIAISAAGIWCDLLVATVAFWTWWFTAPGLLHTSCLIAFLLGTFGTLLFNANPLVRFDGYFILADWLETPNLAEQSSRLLRRLAGGFLGFQIPASSLDSEDRHGLLVSYGLISTSYRWWLVISILWMLGSVLAAHDLHAVAVLVLPAVIGSLSASPMWRTLQFLTNPMFRHQFRPLRCGLALGLVVAAGAGLVSWPLPIAVRATGTLIPANRETVYVAVPGRLTRAVEVGTVVGSQDVLAEMENPELLAEVTQLNGQHATQMQRVESLERQLLLDRADIRQRVSGELDAAREQLSDLAERLKARQAELSRLAIRAPRAGIVLPPSGSEDAVEEEELPDWAPPPLTPSNVGCFLEQGTLLCYIGQPEFLEASLFVPESAVHQVKIGSAVQLRARSLPGTRIDGRIVSVGVDQVGTIPAALAATRRIEMTHQDHGWVPDEPTYEVRVRIDESQPLATLGTVINARIEVAPSTLGRRAWHLARRTFGI